MATPASIELESTLALTPADVGAPVVVGFLDARRDRPVVLGRLRGEDTSEDHRAEQLVIADGRRVRVEAHEQLVLCCGKASISLSADGRVLVRGTYVETRAKGVNRIRGGSVAIN